MLFSLAAGGDLGTSHWEKGRIRACWTSACVLYVVFFFFLFISCSPVLQRLCVLVAVQCCGTVTDQNEFCFCNL